MSSLTRPTTTLSREDVVEDEKNRSISQLVLELRTRFRQVDFERVEKELVAREAELKREIDKLRSENAVLEEKHQFDQLEKLKLEDERNTANQRYEKLLEEVKSGAGCDDNKVVISELRRKNDILESERKRLVDLRACESTNWENSILRLEEEIDKLMNERTPDSRKMKRSRAETRRVISSPVIDLENVFDFDGNGRLAASTQASPSHSKGKGDPQTSGTWKFSSGEAVLIIDSDDEEKMVPKRKRAEENKRCTHDMGNT